MHQLKRHTDLKRIRQTEAAPEDLILSFHIQKIIRGFDIPVVELDGYEADDIIGALANRLSKKDLMYIW